MQINNNYIHKASMNNQFLWFPLINEQLSTSISWCYYSQNQDQDPRSSNAASFKKPKPTNI